MKLVQKISGSKTEAEESVQCHHCKKFWFSKKSLIRHMRGVHPLFIESRKKRTQPHNMNADLLMRKISMRTFLGAISTEKGATWTISFHDIGIQNQEVLTLE